VLFNLDFLRLMSLVVLLPLALSMLADPRTPRLGSTLPDKLVLAYVIYAVTLIFLASSVTNLMRSVLIHTMDILLPYYVASRALKAPEHFRDTLASLVIGAGVMALIGIFESARGWVLYAALKDTLDADNGLFQTLLRGESQRATASTGQPIPLGYMLMIAIVCWLYLMPRIAANWKRILPLLLLGAGLLATMSRGPWVGTAVAILVFVATGPRPVLRLARLGLFGAIAGGVLVLLPGGERLIDLLPFVGEGDAETISYRQQLLDFFVPIIIDNPVFGASSYLYSPEVESLRQGGGIIDLVNTYLIVGLHSGLVGLLFFTGAFASVGLGIWRRLRQEDDPEQRDLGRALLAALAGILVTIFTVSSISIIPYLYWLFAGIGSAYILGKAAKPAPVPRFRRNRPAGTPRTRPA
jgi:hypothetical protein